MINTLRRSTFSLLATGLVLVGFGCATKSSFILPTNEPPAPIGRVTSTTNVPPTPAPAKPQPVTSTIFLVSLEGSAQAKKAQEAGVLPIGCGDYLVPVFVSKMGLPISPMKNALEALLATSEKEAAARGFMTVAGRVSSTNPLRLEGISKDVAGTFIVNFIGSPVLNGVCDDPRFIWQIRETAQQFGTVELHLDGSKKKWDCIGDQSGLCE